jgi:moderate conductance mechanosensitive channel
MLLEDQYGVGDVVTVGRTTGTVEGVSLRITRLRDVNGVVWHVRNGTIRKAGNESQGWARAVVDFPVPYHHDLPRVRQTMLRTADGMWQDPAWHEIILEEPEVWGVQELSSEAVLMRVTARTLPLRQWEVQRELTERLKLALDSAGAINGASTGTEPDGGTGAVVPAQARALPDPHPPHPPHPSQTSQAPPAPDTPASGSPADPPAP